MKRNFLTGFLIASIFGLLLMGCPQSQGGGNKPNPNNPDVPTTKGLIAKVAIQSGNGYKEVPYSGAELNTKAKVQMAVFLKDGLDADAANIDVKLGGVTVAFSAFSDQGYGGARSMCENVQGITAEAKEMIITVTLGNVTDTFSLKLKELDEATLQEIILDSFKIGSTDVVTSIMQGSPSWRFYDPESNKATFIATLSQDIKEAIMIVNGKQNMFQPTAEDKKVVKAELEFEKDSVKVITFVFKAEGCRDLSLNPFSLTFTNKVNAVVIVDATGRGQGRELTDAELMSGKIEFNKCMTTEPKIVVKALKARKAKLTLVSIDGVNQEIRTENPGENEEYVATYTLNPPLTKAGDKKTVKLHVEGVEFGKDSAELPKDALDLEISFTLVQFIEAELQIEADGKPYTKLQEGHRVYSPSIKLKVISKDDLGDVVVKDYKDADDKVPEFEITGKEAVVNLKLKDTGMIPTTFKIVLTAREKTDTTMIVSLRYTAQPDPLGIAFISFASGSVEKELDSDGSYLMTGEEAKLYILLSRNVKELTSMKVNDAEVMGKQKADPDQIVLDAKFESTQGMGGKNNNAIFVFGGDKMEQGKAYEIKISLAGVDEDGRVLSEVTLKPQKIKMPIFDKSSTDWRSPYGGDSDNMEFIEISKAFHESDTAQIFYNYYGIKSYTFGVRTKNPKATVKGIWYRHDTTCKERDEILNATDGENGKYKNHYLQFSPQETLIGKCKWCTTLNFDDLDKKDYGISVYLWVESEDGTKTTKKVACDNTIHTPWEQNFRRLDVMCDYTKHANNVGWGDDKNPGWNKSIPVVDKAEIEMSKVQGNKVYFRATTFGWVKGQMEYHLFNDSVQSPISDFIRIEDANGWNFDNRFTIDVSELSTKEEIEVSIPLWMKSLISGKEFMANVFTRKFKIVKKS